MTMKKKKQLLCEDNLRHNEYYGMQNTIDNLYQASLNGEVFTDLMSVILQRENILLAYRNIKKNTGSKTSGTDNLTIEDIGRCSPDEVVEKVRFIINGSEHGYRPKPVRRKEIPKPYRVYGIDLFNNVSNRYWNLFVRLSSAKTAMDSDRTIRLRTL